jgi:hypothetical protein
MDKGFTCSSDLNPRLGEKDTIHSPERKDRIGDAHGGVILYIKDNIHTTNVEQI